MPSNYSPMHWPPYQDDSSPSQSWKKKKCRSLSKNTYSEEQFVNLGVHMQPISSSSKRKMESYDLYKTTDQSINGQRKTRMFLPSFPKPSIILVDVPCLPSLTSSGDITMYALKMEMNGKLPSSL
jgi:hypothetical protein